MEGGGAYGGGKAGGAFDPITFVQRPHVILRAVCWLFAVIVFGCISSQGWRYDKVTKRQQCLYNDDTNACNYGVGISVIAFLASMAFLAGEYLFEQMSSVKTRKHFVMVDLGFSDLTSSISTADRTQPMQFYWEKSYNKPLFLKRMSCLTQLKALLRSQNRTCGLPPSHLTSHQGLRQSFPV
ncbi:unnamed protein product [Acanthoscelides obtectus]|uniref:MARVEL domain-containing protein n=1 Tax=Acanthoscelides obtectus TaxID=200917 RepID=A0A9P0PMS7_ACAOB|nr:unnamed protein product [Acanthoscelides obtectus]CAK1662793.1 Synaptogyrin [Acanthoscelides obtectus]